jgi:hypothetical protein
MGARLARELKKNPEKIGKVELRREGREGKDREKSAPKNPEKPQPARD